MTDKKVSLNLTQFYIDYKDFDIYQSDFKIKLNGLKLKMSSITKYISLKDDNPNSFTKNAKKSI